MHANAEIIQAFYTAFQARNAEEMLTCYHPEIVFSDPVFGTLHGSEARSMWRMLCERGKDLKIEFGKIQADEKTGSAAWDAWYTFSKNKRRVHNFIEATFVFRDSKIIQHTDRFDLWQWSTMALGPLGKYLGWTPFVQANIRKEARRGLEAFMQKQIAKTA